MDGIINIYKEEGYTSFDVIAKLRGILKTKKIGHTGTLDPMATGVLPVCLGKATKVCALLTDKSKVYETSFRLGLTSDTQDITGTILSENEVNASEETIMSTILSFVGEIDQLTPMYSARKVDGKKLYEYARAGVSVERQTKKVNIEFIDNISICGNEVTMTVGCGAGTYIRTLCNDIGDKLGCGAVMTKLKRIQVDCFSIKDSFTLAEIESLRDTDSLEKCLLDISYVYGDTRKIIAKDELMKYIINGNKLRTDNFDINFEPDELVRVYDESGRFLAMYKNEGEELKVKLLYV